MIRKKKTTKTNDNEVLEEILSGASDPFKDLAYSKYKDLIERRVILINGDIEENIIERVVVQIDQMSKESPKTPITILINSYGGSLYDGLAVVDAIRSTKTPITTVALGKAMSAAFGIFLAGDLRVVHENSILMAHSGWQDGLDMKLSEIVDEAKLNEQLFDRFSNYYASRTKIPRKEWFDLMQSGKDRYFFSEEAIKMGIAHEVYSPQVNKYYPKSPRKRKPTNKKRKTKLKKRRRK